MNVQTIIHGENDERKWDKNENKRDLPEANSYQHPLSFFTLRGRK